MSELTRERIEEILAGCEGVTEGPWRAVERGIFSQDDGISFADAVSGMRGHKGDKIDFANARHIARLDPATVRALCTLALKAEKYREALDTIIAIEQVYNGDSADRQSAYAEMSAVARRARAAYED